MINCFVLLITKGARNKVLKNCASSCGPPSKFGDAARAKRTWPSAAPRPSIPPWHRGEMTCPQRRTG